MASKREGPPIPAQVPRRRYVAGGPCGNGRRVSPLPVARPFTMNAPASSMLTRAKTSGKAIIGRFVATMLALIKYRVAPAAFQIIFELDALIIMVGRIWHGAGSDGDVVFVKTDNLGDFVLWLPIAQALRDQWPWPGRRFVLVANAGWSKFAAGSGLFDKLVAVEISRFQRNPAYRIATLFRLAGMPASVVVTPILARNPTTANSIARAIAATRKIAVAVGQRPTAVGRARSDAWYSELVSTQQSLRHEAFGNREFIEKALPIKVANLWPELAVPPGIELPDALRGRAFVVMAPGASSTLRTWPPEHFAAIADRLSRQFSLNVVLIGAASDRRRAAAVSRRAATPLIDLTAQLDFRQLLTLLKTAKLILTNETGIAHLGAALRVPTIAITGGGHFRSFLPYPPEADDVGVKLVTLNHNMTCYGCNWRCIHRPGIGDPAPCVAAVSIDRAWTAVQPLLLGAQMTAYPGPQ